MQDNVKQPNIIEVSKEGEKEGQKKILRATIAKNVPNSMKTISP